MEEGRWLTGKVIGGGEGAAAASRRRTDGGSGERRSETTARGRNARVANGGVELNVITAHGCSGDELRRPTHFSKKPKWIEVGFYNKIPWASEKGFGSRPELFGPEFEPWWARDGLQTLIQTVLPIVAEVEPEKLLELADVEPDVTSEGTSGLEPADVEPDDHAEPELVGPAACESADPAAPEPEDHAESADPAELQPSVWEPPEQLLRQPPGQLAGLPPVQPA
ncbi:hypothetical protein DY000_02030289 [Brassica cretica]|uniref:Uncharacterized protein n=1 Tax=Brassica cretica TaxID=69181 RepID=A0ABQ7DWC5_BRACR|nr:hypothetical protein DY000_02030289 [Brassica cretica]